MLPVQFLLISQLKLTKSRHNQIHFETIPCSVQSMMKRLGDLFGNGSSTEPNILLTSLHLTIDSILLGLVLHLLHRVSISHQFFRCLIDFSIVQIQSDPSYRSFGSINPNNHHAGQEVVAFQGVCECTEVLFVDGVVFLLPALFLRSRTEDFDDFVLDLHSSLPTHPSLFHTLFEFLYKQRLLARHLRQVFQNQFSSLLISLDTEGLFSKDPLLKHRLGS